MAKKAETEEAFMGKSRKHGYLLPWIIGDTVDAAEACDPRTYTRDEYRIVKVRVVEMKRKRRGGRGK